MKLATRILSLLVLAAFATFYMSCDGDDGDGQSEQQIQFNKVKSTWVMETANDGTDRTLDFPGLALTLALDETFQENGVFEYSLEGTRPNPSPWPASGTWKFDSSDPTHKIIRDTGDSEIPVTYEVSDTDLLIEFDIPEGHPGFAGSRVSSVSGHWIFTFSKQQ
jgi:hypothetical protein